MTRPTTRQLMPADDLLPGDRVLELTDQLAPGATITRKAQVWPSETGELLELEATLDGTPAWAQLHDTEAVVVAQRPHLAQRLAIIRSLASAAGDDELQQQALTGRAELAELERRLVAMLEGAYANAERLRVQVTVQVPGAELYDAQADKRRAIELAAARAYADALALLSHTTTTDQLEAAAERRLAAREL